MSSALQFALTRAPGKSAGTLVVPVDPKSPTAIACLDGPSNAAVRSVLTRGDLEAKAGKTLLLANVADGRYERVLLVARPSGTVSATDFRSMASAAATALAALPGKRALWQVEDVEVDGLDAYAKLRSSVVALIGAAYRYDRHKSKPSEATGRLAHVDLLISTDDRSTAERALRDGRALGEAMHTTRDVGNAPPNELTPTAFAGEARKLARSHGLKVKVLGEKEMRDLGMGSFLSVGAGSRQESKMIVLEHRGGAAGNAPYVIVGKGITFDTGGISLKPAAAMDEMKYDMCGAASVLGTMQAVADLKLPIDVIGVIAAAENMPGGGATRPGDIVRSMSGQTIEILNTDAEGRLVLCDALTYVERFKPAAVIDVATLTGAVIVALGSVASGLWANNDELAEQLRSASDSAADRVWQFPMWEEYQPLLKSNFADMANVGGGRDAGSTVAACFLARFTKAYPWAHLDVAGTAYRSGAAKGATGRPVPLLLQFLLDRAAAATSSRAARRPRRRATRS